MMRSMTGVGLAASETGPFLGSVSVRSLNHRFLDLSVRCSRSVALLEPELRERVQSRVSRGKIEVAIRGEITTEHRRLTVDSELAAAYVSALREVARANDLPEALDLATLSRLQGVVGMSEVESPLAEDARTQILGLLDEALDSLDAMREAEGTQLAEALRRHLKAITSEIDGIAALVDIARSERLQALRERGRSLCQDLGVDENRLYLELARLVDRCDVAEELDRLRSHVGQASPQMAKRGTGKSMDFLAQEMMREANTIGSKSIAAEVTHRVVSLKASIERFREQVQNVE